MTNDEINPNDEFLSRLVLFAALAGGLICGGCKQSNGPANQTVQTNNPAVKLNVTNLVVECERLAVEGAAQSKDTWTAAEQLPPTIKSLAPQRVQLRKTESPAATVVDIQTSGGFQHGGYLVVCTNTDSNFVPQKGRNWRIIKIAPGIFQYQE